MKTAWKIGLLLGAVATGASIVYLELKHYDRIVSQALAEALKGKTFRKGVDLGCGSGEKGRIIRPHVQYLIGVDRNPNFLKEASKTGLYDELVLADINNYRFDSDVNLVCIIEVIEHLSHADGESLLLKLQMVPHIILSTPTFYWKYVPGYTNWGPHLSFWTSSELQQFGFKSRILPWAILATRQNPEIKIIKV